MNNPTHQTGHLYAIEFSSGTVKVGQSTDITRRVAVHVAAATAHGITANRVWISERVDRLDQREQELLAFCRARWKLTTGGEYFHRADLTQIVQQANGSGIATRELSGQPVPSSSPMEGTSWGKPFKGHPTEAAAVRAWTYDRIPDPDAVQVAHELFVAVLLSGADVVQMQLSTAGPRLRITALGTDPLPVRHSHGPGWRVVAGLSRQTGVTADECGLWAQMEPVR